MIYQELSLAPHLSVEDNISLGLRSDTKSLAEEPVTTSDSGALRTSSESLLSPVTVSTSTDSDFLNQNDASPLANVSITGQDAWSVDELLGAPWDDEGGLDAKSALNRIGL